MSYRTARSEKHEKIIRAAARMFAQKGFFNTSIAEIAAEAGVGKGTIYEYVSSKDDLFFSVFEWISENSWAQARIGLSALSGTASEKIRTIGRSVIEQWNSMEEYYALMMEFWCATTSSQLRDRFKDVFDHMYKEFRALVSGLIIEGIERGEFRSDIDPEAMAAALVGTFDALVLQDWFNESFDAVNTAEQFLSVVIQGMKAPG
jgi:AcrR family transcriptional regulator